MAFSTQFAKPETLRARQRFGSICAGLRLGCKGMATKGNSRSISYNNQNNLINRSGEMNNYGGGGGGSGLEGQYDMERQNDGQVNLLAERVSALKSITLQIGNEVQDQNRFLGGMTSDFDRTRGFLGSTMGRLQRMMGTQSSKYTFYMIFFVMFVMMVTYWIVSRGK